MQPMLKSGESHRAAAMPSSALAQMPPTTVTLEPLDGAPLGHQGRLVRVEPAWLEDPSFCTALSEVWRSGNGLLCIRGGGPLSPARLVELTRYFGEPERMDVTKMEPDHADGEELPAEVMIVGEQATPY
jgi:hypothetical protein